MTIVHACATTKNVITLEPFEYELGAIDGQNVDMAVSIKIYRLFHLI